MSNRWCHAPKKAAVRTDGDAFLAPPCASETPILPHGHREEPRAETPRFDLGHHCHVTTETSPGLLRNHPHPPPPTMTVVADLHPCSQGPQGSGEWRFTEHKGTQMGAFSSNPNLEGKKIQNFSASSTHADPNRF
jgi:hypothetical protein